VYHENLGRTYRKKGQAAEAERELAEASRLSPNDPIVWSALGHLFVLTLMLVAVGATG